MHSTGGCQGCVGRADDVGKRRRSLLLGGLRRDIGRIVTDKLGSYSAALRELGLAHLHVTGGRLNNRAEVSHQPTRRRERRMGRFKSPGSMQRFLSVHDAIYNHFNVQRHLISRQTLRQTRAEAFAEWHQIVAA